MDKREYVARVNRVIDHIRLHLDDELSLEALAEIASFSPFHFHRIFKALVGENLNDFVRRLRLEKAATLLRFRPALSVTEVALESGFSSSAVFARAFRQHFGLSATEYRSGGAPVAASHDPGGSANAADGPGDPPVVEIVQLPRLRIAYIRHYHGFETGVYSKALSDAFGRIARWLLARDLLTAESLCVGIQHDNVAITPGQKRAYDAGFTVPANFTPGEGEVGVQEIPGARYAVCRIAAANPGGSGAIRAIWELGQAATYLYGTWLPESGYELEDQPALEIYHTHNTEFRVDFCLAVRPA